MSRRQDRYPDPSAKVTIVCTDRGTHCPVFLAEGHVDEHGHVVITRRALERGQARAGRSTAASGGATWSFGPCTECPRHPQLRHEHLAELLRKLREQGHDRVDLSYMP